MICNGPVFKIHVHCAYTLIPFCTRAICLLSSFNIILPGPGSFRGRAAYGAFEYAPLIEALSARKIDVLDVGAAMMVRGVGNYCELYANPAECSGHFGIAGGAIVAEIVAAELRQRGLVN